MHDPERFSRLHHRSAPVTYARNVARLRFSGVLISAPRAIDNRRLYLRVVNDTASPATIAATAATACHYDSSSPTIFPPPRSICSAREGWTVDARTGRTPEQLAADLANADAIVVRSATKVTAALIAAAPRLRAIARAGTGVDNVDVTAASARGIVVMNAPGANSVSVAELAMGLILALARHLPAADAAMKQGKWEKKKFLGEEVRDKTLGLAGLGRIGQEVARRAAAFGMRLVAHDPFVSAARRGRASASS